MEKIGEEQCDVFSAESDLQLWFVLHNWTWIVSHARACSVIPMACGLDRIGKKYERF